MTHSLVGGDKEFFELEGGGGVEERERSDEKGGKGVEEGKFCDEIVCADVREGGVGEEYELEEDELRF
ncbi:hypothetical protein, partial [Bacillus sp. WP8]|uniref:hypothetical protein n=1 Tax=Bacillus sp. WP8 TaxID=756828 RepID=UPI0037BEA1C5